MRNNSCFRCRKWTEAKNYEGYETPRVHEIENMPKKRQSLMKVIAVFWASTLSPEYAKNISGYLKIGDDVRFENRRIIVDGLISRIQVTSENVRLNGKI